MSASHRSVAAELNYLDDPHRIEDGDVLHYYADFSGSTNVRLAPQIVPIHDARAIAHRFDLDRQGIAIARHPSKIRTFEEADANSDRYIAECEQLIRDLTGAVATFGGGLHCRFAGADDPRSRYDKGPAHYVHADYSDRAAANFAAYLSADVSACRRYAIYNLWRALTPPPFRTPLAVCDAQSIDKADEVESIVVMDYPDRDSIRTQTTLYRPNANHRWYYFSDIEPDEILIFKSHDSDSSCAKRVAHSAFADATASPGRARISLEARVLAGFD